MSSSVIKTSVPVSKSNFWTSVYYQDRVICRSQVNCCQIENSHYQFWAVDRVGGGKPCLGDSVDNFLFAKMAQTVKEQNKEYFSKTKYSIFHPNKKSIVFVKVYFLFLFFLFLTCGRGKKGAFCKHNRNWGALLKNVANFLVLIMKRKCNIIYKLRQREYSVSYHSRVGCAVLKTLICDVSWP